MAFASEDIDLCAYPAAKPPPGVTPNFDNPVSLAAAVISVCTILTTLAVLVVIARLYINWSKLSLADYFMAVGAIFDIAYTGLMISLGYSSLQDECASAPGKCSLAASSCEGTRDITLTRAAKIIYAHTTIVYFVLFFPKAAILLLYRQLFYINRKTRAGVWVGLVFCVLIYVPGIPMQAIYTAPKAGQSWDELSQSLAAGSGDPVKYWGAVQGFCSVALDVYIFILPLPALSKLQIPFRKKAQIFALFASGLIGIAASIVGAVSRLGFLTTTDGTWHQAENAMFVVAENNVIIVVGCMPAFAHFVRHVRANISTRLSRSKLRGSSKDSHPDWETHPPLPYFNGKADASGRKAPRNNYDLTDTMLLETQISTVPEASGKDSAIGGGFPKPPGIVRTTGIHQKESRPGGSTQWSQSAEELL